MSYRYRVIPLLAGSFVACSCSADDGGAPDAGVDAGPDADNGNCEAGEIESQGDWVDWDSTDMAFRGIFDATISEGANSAQTAPNGRIILCLASGVDHELDFSQATYLPMTASLHADNLREVYTSRGLTPARADELFTTELSLTRDTAAAQILVQRPVGTGVAIDTTSAGEFEVPSGDYTFFANVPVGGGQTNLTITPPGGQSCTAVDSVPLAAGTTAFTAVVCN